MLLPVWQEGQGPQAQLCPFEVWVLAEEVDLSWQLLQGQVPRPCTTSSLREQSAQDTTNPQVPQAPQMVGARAHRLRFTTASRPGPRPVGGPSKGSGALQDTAPSLFPVAHTAHLPGKLERRTHLLPHSLPDDHHSTAWFGWLNPLN